MLRLPIVMKPLSTPKSLPLPTDSLPAKRFEELTSEEAALRHRLELKAERSLYKATVGLQRLQGLQTYDSTPAWLSHLWGNEQKIEEASSEAMTAIRELCERRLYRNTHHRFEQYLSDPPLAAALRYRFSWCTEEISPESRASTA